MENIVSINKVNHAPLSVISSPFGIISMKACAEYLGVAPSTLYTWRAKGAIPADCFKEVCGKIFVKVKEMRAFFAS